MTTHTQQILERFNKKFDGMWLDGMHDYENDTIYSEKETKEKLKDFITSELSTLENAVREEVRSEAYNDIKKIIQDQKLSDEEYLNASSMVELRKGFEVLKKRLLDMIGEV